MKELRKILVRVDVEAAAQPAFERATELAKRNGAALTVVDVVEEFPAYARLLLPRDLQRHLAAFKTERVAAIGARAREQGVKVVTKVLSGRSTTEIVREVLRNGHDLVLKDVEAGTGAGASRGLGDMQLLRKCPCPVWLLRPSHGKHFDRVLAAVDPEPEDGERNALCEKILRFAIDMSGSEWAELHILRAWSAYGASVLRNKMTPDEFRRYVEGARTNATRSLQDLLTRFSPAIDPGHVHVEEGEPHEVITKFVQAHQVDVVVLGTVARTGLPGLIIGNTAEQVLSQITCSVLALKPDGFVSPITLDPALEAARGAESEWT